MLEATFKIKVKERILSRFPNLDLDFIDVDPQNHRSMIDLIVLGPDVWAALEVKRSEDASHRPNQDYHVNRLNEKGFAAFVYPENLEEVIDELENLFSI